MKKMTHTAREELADAIRARYTAATANNKRRILDEFIAATGYHERTAIRLLNSAGSKRPQTRRRPSLYDETVRGGLAPFPPF